MKLRIAVGSLNQIDQFKPVRQAVYEARNPEEAAENFKKFFTDNPDISIPQNAELILQSGDPMTIASILSIKYFLNQEGMGLEYYAYEDSEDSILDDITRTSGLLLLDEAQSFYGFIPRGYFLRFASEDEATPIKVYSWIGDTVRLFPSASSDPYNTTLHQVKEFENIMGTISTPVIAKFSQILAAFKKRILII
jgi:hypothetical protein